MTICPEFNACKAKSFEMDAETRDRAVCRLQEFSHSVSEYRSWLAEVSMISSGWAYLSIALRVGKAQDAVRKRLS